MKTCSIDGCEGSHEARGYCKEHYQQWYRYGDPMARFRGRRGAGWTSKHGYRFNSGKQEHISVAEKSLGKQLPSGAVVHHLDGNPGNNDSSNLLVCPSQAYHRLIHQREKAFDACGHADHRKCVRCGVYEAAENMVVQSAKGKALSYQHHGCRSKQNVSTRS